MARAIAIAAAMPLAERKMRWEAMMKILRGHTIQQWSADFVAELEKCRVEKAAVAPLAAQPPQALRWLKSAISGVRLI
jgi:trehalose 6-phosphate synthase